MAPLAATDSDTPRLMLPPFSTWKSTASSSAVVWTVVVRSDCKFNRPWLLISTDTPSGAITTPDTWA